MVQMFMRNLEKVSALRSVCFRVSALERFCYKGFFRNSFGTKFYVRLREVSSLEDVRFREVPLYLCNHENNVDSRLPQWFCGKLCTWAHDYDCNIFHHVPKCMSCQKAILLITGMEFGEFFPQNWNFPSSLQK